MPLKRGYECAVISSINGEISSTPHLMTQRVLSMIYEARGLGQMAQVVGLWGAKDGKKHILWHHTRWCPPVMFVGL